MTRYPPDRDSAGRLPLSPDGEPACPERLKFDETVACQGAAGHAPPCRHYGDQAGAAVALVRYEWWPTEPWPIVQVRAENVTAI